MGEIQPRDYKFGVADAPKRHWLRGDMEHSALVDCFGVLLPEGERFFIRSLKFYEPKIEDPVLIEEMRGFYQQEAFHSREHAGYNAAMSALGYDVSRMEEFGAALLGDIKTHSSRLAVTCALEHLTTTFSRTLLQRPDLLDGAHEPYRELWLWHALEELEHRSVALEVYAVVMMRLPAWKRYLFRTMAMNMAVYTIARAYIHNLKLYAEADGVKPGFRFTMRCLRRMFISPGFIMLGLPYFLKYYLPGYDPAGADRKGLVQRWRALIVNRNASGTS